MSEEYIEWIEPFGPNNEPVFCRVPVATAIATQRHIALTSPKQYEYPTDQAALEDFIVCHWADRITV
jgi:hypothetical protein